MTRKLIRVSLQYEDGTIQRLTGSEADRWLTAVNGCCHVSQLHHCPMPDFEWETLLSVSSKEEEDPRGRS